MYTIQHNPARHYNCDETGITIVQHKHTEILGLKGKHQISSVQSAERGSLVTVVNCMSPTGQFIPPLLVFPRTYMKKELTNGTLSRSIHACHPSGWIQSKIFTQCFLHFIKHTKPTKLDLILVPDGHYTHTHTKHEGHYFSSRESCWHHFPIHPPTHPPHNSNKCNPYVKLSWGPLKHSIAKKFKNSSVKS